jgi:hypothetical protein
MSAVDGSRTGRDGSRIESSDTKGLDEGEVSGESKGVWGSDSVGVERLELGTEAGIVIGGGVGRDEMVIALALAEVRTRYEMCHSMEALTRASGRRGRSSTIRVCLILRPFVPKYLVDSKDQCRDPTIQSARPWT